MFASSILTKTGPGTVSIQSGSWLLAMARLYFCSASSGWTHVQATFHSIPRAALFMRVKGLLSRVSPLANLVAWSVRLLVVIVTTGLYGSPLLSVGRMVVQPLLWLGL